MLFILIVCVFVFCVGIFGCIYGCMMGYEFVFVYNSNVYVGLRDLGLYVCVMMCMCMFMRLYVGGFVFCKYGV